MIWPARQRVRFTKAGAAGTGVQMRSSKLVTLLCVTVGCLVTRAAFAGTVQYSTAGLFANNTTTINSDINSGSPSTLSFADQTTTLINPPNGIPTGIVL